MTTDITELAQREKFEAWFKSSFHPDKTGPYIKDQLYFAWKAAGAELVEALEKARQRIAELENNEIQEEGNQFLVVRHPGKVPVIKHPVGDLEDYLRQIFKADPLATIDIVTHRYYGVGGQFVEDADEYLHEMSIKVEAE
ncbi:hypothetical protein AAHW35_09905 [Klebsiella quasipneumoniae subsp. similipneumoniae]|uniref:hypothetical protein n=1 Tax=Klebsiella pneumoniae complex TaxID=3390273 RepID=UPI0018DB5065|nr:MULTISPECIES: hypothetical protein [Klebsiella]MBH8476295.1 hypothetical protein [Klebsiella quasipneumoniae]MDA4018847.1 hypothetical protein [Klebsiella pneumoniae]